MKYAYPLKVYTEEEYFITDVLDLPGMSAGAETIVDLLHRSVE